MESEEEKIKRNQEIGVATPRQKREFSFFVGWQILIAAGMLLGVETFSSTGSIQLIEAVGAICVFTFGSYLGHLYFQMER